MTRNGRRRGFIIRYSYYEKSMFNFICQNKIYLNWHRNNCQDSNAAGRVSPGSLPPNFFANNIGDGHDRQHRIDAGRSRQNASVRYEQLFALKRLTGRIANTEFR